MVNALTRLCRSSPLLAFFFRALPVHSQFCTDSLNSIALREALVTDTSFPRTYVLCPGLDYQVGTLDFDRRVENGQPGIPLRSNLRVMCGDDGARENECNIRGGDVLVDGTDHFGVAPRVLENVVLEGLTFFNSSKYMVAVNQPGKVQFRDCEFRENRYVENTVLVDFWDRSRANLSAVVSFEGCKFEDNLFQGYPGQPSIVASKSRQSHLIFDATVWNENDMYNSWDIELNTSYVAAKSYLVEASGPITVTRNCFSRNTVGVAPFALYGRGPNLFADNHQYLSTGRFCPLAANFEDPERFESFSPLCTDFDVDGSDCPIDGSPPPVGVPSSMPSDFPSNAPVMAPSASPSMLESSSPSVRETEPPVLSPTLGPSNRPTLSPQAAPSLAPVGSPTPMPSLGEDASPTASPFLSSLTDILTDIPTPSPSSTKSVSGVEEGGHSGVQPLAATTGIASFLVIVVMYMFDYEAF